MRIGECTLTLCSPGRGLTPAEVIVEWRKNYCMQQHSTFSCLINRIWEKEQKEGKNLFNASKFRLHGMDLEKEDEDAIPNIKFLIGTTSYKDYIGTNCAPYSSLLKQEGEIYHGNCQAYMSDALGTGALLVTIDDKIIFIRRSDTCAEMQRMIDRPGGHPEPEEVSASTENMEDVNPSLIVKELFDCIRKEIRDEINIPMEYLSNPVLLGVGYNIENMHKPSLEFFVRCRLNSSEVQDLYDKQTQAEAEESTELLVVPIDKVLNTDVEKLKFYKELTQPAQCAISFLKEYI